QAIKGLTSEMVDKLNAKSRDTWERISRLSVERLMEIMGCEDVIAEDVLELCKAKLTPAAAAASTPVLPAGSAGSVLRVEMSDPKDLSGASSDDLAARFADPSQRRLPHVVQEVERRTGGVVVIDASGNLMTGLTARLMDRVAVKGIYSGETFAFGGEEGHVVPLQRFLFGLAASWHSPVTGEELNEDGSDPQMGGVIYPIGDETFMFKIAWVMRNGRGFDLSEPGEVSDILHIVR